MTENGGPRRRSWTDGNSVDGEMRRATLRIARLKRRLKRRLSRPTRRALHLPGNANRESRAAPPSRSDNEMAPAAPAFNARGRSSYVLPVT
jgi:hypothetical protein